MPFGFVDTARTFAGISVIAAASTLNSKVSGSLGRISGLGDSSSVFFARTHEFLQYHFRTVALAFEYDKDRWSRKLPSASGLPILGMERV